MRCWWRSNFGNASLADVYKECRETPRYVPLASCILLQRLGRVHFLSLAPSQGIGRATALPSPQILRWGLLEPTPKMLRSFTIQGIVAAQLRLPLSHLLINAGIRRCSPARRISIASALIPVYRAGPFMVLKIQNTLHQIGK